MEEKKLRSGIVGQAQVVFGGAIVINVGTVGGDENTLTIGLAELCNPAAYAGGEIDDRAETYGMQVELVFPDLHALNNFCSVFEDLEVMLEERMAKQKEDE